MKKALILLFLPLIVLFSSRTIFANLLPSPSGFVSDYAGVLTSGQKNTLETNLSDYEKKSGNEIAVVFIKPLVGEIIPISRQIGQPPFPLDLISWVVQHLLVRPVAELLPVS